MRISDWSSDVCSSDLNLAQVASYARREAIMTRPDSAYEACIMALMFQADSAPELRKFRPAYRDGPPTIPVNFESARPPTAGRTPVSILDRKSTRLNSSQ